ncbi:MAG: DNA mismatch endonuclease Vsr [Gammaproteobacteria bacterium]|nr:DNA mismatch endonuclease Vsr [Gammaproteobacteria bacterium]
MADIVDKVTRSRMMAKIRSRNTGPEVALRRALHAVGVRFRIHAALPGTPDLAFRRYGAVCFVHGCFWHRHRRCPLATTPSTRPEFWQAKFDGNVQRDRLSKQELLKAGWRVAVVWECALTPDRISDTVHALHLWLRSSSEQNFETGAIVAEPIGDNPFRERSCGPKQPS